jgi:pimeloyl-ACP methyl ester carboxylesterase/DNA-binding CsgD family transcriptional regulator
LRPGADRRPLQTGAGGHMAAADPLHPRDEAVGPEVSAVLRSAGYDTALREAAPVLNAQSIAAAVVTRSGELTCQSAAFSELGGLSRLDPELLARAADGAGPLTSVAALPASGDPPDTAVFAYVRASRAEAWRLPPEVADAAAAHPDHVAVLTSQAAPPMRPLEDACRSSGLTGLQTRVVLETIRTGHVKAAARRLELSYDTAREALGGAMRRVQARRLPALVTRIATLAFGVLPEEDGADILGDLWGLTRRQAAIAALIAEGLSRAEAAKVLGLSPAVVKKEIDRAFLMLQVGSAAALARKIVEARAFRWITRATGDEIGFLEPGAEPLQFVLRREGGRIAVSDYGPRSGRPVLVVHSSLTTRVVARGLARALQSAGLRPISVDRPGFGLTDEPARQAVQHHYEAAARDTVQVLDHLKIRRADVVARGGAQFVLALARLAPDRLGRVLLVNPDPHSAASTRDMGLYGVMKTAFARNPAIIRMSAAIIARQFTLEGVERILQRAMVGSPPDEAAVRDPEILRDYFRAQRPFATGRIAGAVAEQTDFARGRQPEPLVGTTAWKVLIGAFDTLHDPQQVLAYWRDVLPDAEFEVVPDAGRLLALSHPDHVVRALTNG